MRVAHLILAHSNPDQLQRLIGRLSHPDADFYIHIDLKSPIDEFLHLAKNEHVFFIKKREKVLWGAYSVVQATINGFEYILQSGIEYNYINLLSGQDYPLRGVGSIHRFLKDHPGKAFMHSLSVKDQWQEAIPRLEKYYLSNYPFPGNYQLERALSFFLPKRKMPNGLIPVGRSQWFTITPVHAKYILLGICKRTKM